jgi:hypothetical protein
MTWFKKSYLKAISFAAIMMLLVACKVNYSFTGASIDPAIKTVSIQYFQNNASLAPNTINQVFTEALKDIISTQTSLNLVPKYGDVRFNGAIVNFNVSPAALQSSGGNNAAAINRLTITVEMKFENTKDDKLSYSQTFTNFADFPTTSNLITEQNRLMKEISNKIVQDIFNKSFVNW